MAQGILETTYEPEVEEEARRKRERRVVQEGTTLWRRRKEELQRQKHREQREVCVRNGCLPPPASLRCCRLCHLSCGDHPLTSLSRGAIVTDRIKVSCARYGYGSEMYSVNRNLPERPALRHRDFRTLARLQDAGNTQV